MLNLLVACVEHSLLLTIVILEDSLAIVPRKVMKLQFCQLCSQLKVTGNTW